MTQSMDATPAGRSGDRAAAAVDRASRNESGYATIQNQPMGAGHVMAPSIDSRKCQAGLCPGGPFVHIVHFLSLHFISYSFGSFS